MSSNTVLKLEHEPLKSLREVQSEIENAPDPQCRCLAYDDADCDLRDVQRCIRKALEDEYGVVDERDYRMGRGMPKG